ncbi:siroheme synthase [Devosia pacifica]|uniref:Siroheme synthase n=1 Tax=Devosia pacifica TaxID=1335967 RepID=A0A918VPL5_9HYPH|nr:siroheme synthase CysG [Devosia pacifica]GHA14899.1 siroheme synthase [Devosia pacifica]
MTKLNTFPVSLKVEGKKVVVVGGDDEALNKVRLLAKTSARLVVIASVIEADFSPFDLTVCERRFVPEDLDGAAMVFVADHGPDGQTAKCAARTRRVPLNVVDVPHECDFYTPSIIDRAPISIAISSEGAAPVLARLVRAQIEALLSPNLGAVAQLAGRLRKRVETLIPPGPRRRWFYEDLVTSRGVDEAVGQGGGDDLAETLLTRHAESAEGKGEVWLIGAGPGAEDLLTLRAQRLLQQADVIVHDQLVPEAVVQMGRRDAEQIPVGKAKGHHSFTQAQINTLIVRLAHEGKKVARLKSGDPMVFGRAGEEIAALRKEGIAYTIVPGVTSALAAAADTSTPVTLRKVSSGFVMATAHGADDTDLKHWASLASSGLSLALYMGKSTASDVAAKLIGHGAGGHLPIGIVVNAGRTDKSLHSGSLEALARGTLDLPAGPAIIFVGEAVAAGNWTDATSIIPQSVEAA